MNHYTDYEMLLTLQDDRQQQELTLQQYYEEYCKISSEDLVEPQHPQEINQIEFNYALSFLDPSKDTYFVFHTVLTWLLQAPLDSLTLSKDLFISFLEETLRLLNQPKV